MFVFAIAAIYTNTKEAAEQRDFSVQENKTDSNDNNYSSQQKRMPSSNIVKRIDNLESRIEQISNNQSSGSNVSADLHCSIQGVMDGDNVVPLSQADAIAEARQADKELVMICSFN